MAADRRSKRLIALGVVSMSLIGLLAVRMWFMQVVDAPAIAETVTANRTRTVVLLPERGRIFDADGRILADNERVLTVTVERSVIRRSADRLALFQRLSGPLRTPVETLEERYQSKRYDPLLPLPVKEGVNEETVLFLRERVEDYPGVGVQEQWSRDYPYAPLASHVVGYLGAIRETEVDFYRNQGYLLSERVGQFGVEQTFEYDLRGTPGWVRYEVDSRGVVLRELERQDPVAGKDLVLTIDLDLQQFAEETLETQLRDRRLLSARNPRAPNGEFAFPQFPAEVPFKAPAGSVVVLDHRTNSVIAMASYPTFDNRWFNAGVSSDRFAEVFPRTDDPDLSILVNRAIQGRYNLGSTFKPFVAYAALNTGQLPGGVDYRIVDRGTYRLSEASVDRSRCDQVRCEFRNAVCAATNRPCVYGSVNVIEALAVSSDVFFYKIGDEIFTQRGGLPVLQEQVRLFGFGARTGIELPYESPGTVPDAEVKRRLADDGLISQDEGRGYYVGDNVQLAIGQGLLSATPLQLAQGYAAFANGGRIMRPHIVHSILAPGTPDHPTLPGFGDLAKATVLERRARPDVQRTIELGGGIGEAINTGLARVITGPGVRSDYYHSTTGERLFRTYPYEELPIAGKTGTAQGLGNQPWNDSSTFAAYGLNDDTPYTVAAYLEKSGYGSRAAAPVVKCVYMALAAATALHPVLLSDPLDLTMPTAAPSRSMPSRACLAGQFGFATE
jgi:penicillin-binding protein 2